MCFTEKFRRPFLKTHLNSHCETQRTALRSYVDQPGLEFIEMSLCLPSARIQACANMLDINVYFKQFMFILWVNMGIFTSLHVHVYQVCALFPWRPEEGVEFPRTGVIDPNLDPLQEQQLLLTTEPSY